MALHSSSARCFSGTRNFLVDYVNQHEYHPRTVSNLDLAYLNLFVQTKRFGCTRYQFFFTVCIPIACFSFTLGATSDDLMQVCKKSAINSLFDKLVLQNQHHNFSIPLMVPFCLPVLLLVFNVQHNGNRRGVEGSPTNYLQKI